MCSLQSEAVTENQPNHTPANSQQQKTPEQVRAHPKAYARKQSGSRGARRRKTAIITDSPVKKQLLLQAESRKVSKTKVPAPTFGDAAAPKASSSRGGPAKRSKRDASQRRVAKVRKPTVRDADNCCNSCGGQYGSKSDKRIKEQWFKCDRCTKWAHESCGNFDDKQFHCLMCIDSDSDQ